MGEQELKRVARAVDMDCMRNGGGDVIMRSLCVVKCGVVGGNHVVCLNECVPADLNVVRTVLCRELAAVGRVIVCSNSHRMNKGKEEGSGESAKATMVG